MASFGWKRKVGERVSRSVVRQFEAEEEEKAEDDDGGSREEEEVDWLHAIKRRREVLLQDCAANSSRLKDEGAQLAEQGRHWEAIKKWDEAIQLTPDNSQLYEMKSQVLTILHEVFPAVKAAEMAVKFQPLWWEGWQTLGRAQLNLGEVDLAVRSFQIAIHLRPSETSLWQDDLNWARTLQKQQAATKEKIRQEEETKNQLLHAPELEQDYDFESDEVLAACVAVAERQTHYEELRRTTVVIDAEGKIQNVVSGEQGSEDPAAPSKEQFVKARGL
ncbi:tetratricopeptide repeat protein 33 [Kryptolebias marmoratus]|uniref:Tetratricopeptide repeat domain 33 n=1 Tax=Kryptolebias marmoratus TaxID=37003 RepID=A0A3Q3A7M8_KRYMA|nr:tetratricopeptide repeat protein 33 [Kryptolebias marmoratus]XP_017263457.1 tetratricopeptide repeat protein 33 [Kryptolebias marmoratus]XP_024859894.1 tetratricopeptide repeat protein 33 [Kryptolebias marmoratus]XP_037835315.1 tetratricopeptide repeat protein 33 [Kryptolebias marmoratus]